MHESAAGWSLIRLPPAYHRSRQSASLGANGHLKLSVVLAVPVGSSRRQRHAEADQAIHGRLGLMIVGVWQLARIPTILHHVSTGMCNTSRRLVELERGRREGTLS